MDYTSKQRRPPGGHIFQQTRTIFKLSLAIIRSHVLTNKTAPPTGGHTCRVSTRKTAPTTAPPPSGHFDEDWTINVTSKVTNLLTKFHEDQKYIKRLTTNDERRTTDDGQ
ncbi:hypothetical protein DPMN_068612 [Dreissena polymorpha]|uniref:Uncharacterized protein n=1 Tax=Dreissena polymorpha TaxID=45954 RepID=A0A9D3Z1H4_DREPO|nr:hypothetical protein DPMN_068612 [Dreissena polymorpha]